MRLSDLQPALVRYDLITSKQITLKLIPLLLSSLQSFKTLSFVNSIPI